MITRYRDANANLRSQLKRIIARAGLVAWPKLFQNLRASRETELVEQYPIHVVCAWLGNSPRVATKHYLQVRDSDFSSAVAKADALQPALQLLADVAAPSGTTKVDDEPPPTEFREESLGADTCNLVNKEPVTPTGLEPVLPP